MNKRTPKPKANTATTPPSRPAAGPAVPPGYIVRTGSKLVLSPIRGVGPRTAEILQVAVNDFGFLIPMAACITDTLSGFASRIELYTSDRKARAVADTLHRLSA
ncbi:hypothetical protein J3A72_000457 [Stenotrophomonas sp. PvP093]|jgi:hypothetical protein|uniref:hypothetical protein n=1 Tax=unclassified Stenotrophomonas TaxID=196198 RepID=UPI001FD97232|nr:hypothetical protein [Stenotrophomonas sp. PvP093]MBP2480165.1 hypothetical protein [Stenotrophomonas sp. PvP093]